MSCRPSRISAVALLLATLLVAIVVPRLSTAAGDVDGRWHELGLPQRSRAPMLWDSAGRRLVVAPTQVLPDLGNFPTNVLSGWEFRPGSGWSRLPVGGPPVQREYWAIADPERRRFLAVAAPPNPRLDSVCTVWELRLDVLQGWAELPGLAPWSTACMLEPGTDRLWQVARIGRSITRALWVRSLADTGAWRMVRYLPEVPPPGGLYEIDSARDQLVSLTTAGYGADSVNVWTIALHDTTPWVRRPPPGVQPGRRQSPLWTLDRAHDRLMLMGGYTSTYRETNEVWQWDLAGGSGWSRLGSFPQCDVSAGVALARDTLWIHGAARSLGGPAVRTMAVPLVDPAHPVIVSDPDWPALDSIVTMFTDPAHDRWLGFGSAHDSVWVLRCRGDRAEWKREAVPGEVPPPDNLWLTTSALDAATGTAYLAGRSSDRQSGALWALEMSDVPRWRQRVVSDSLPARTYDPVLVFDPVGRRLFDFDAARGAHQVAEVWSLAVDSSNGWRREAPSGPPPVAREAEVAGSSAVYEAGSDRILFGTLGPSAGLWALELRPELRWIKGPSCPMTFQMACGPVADGTRGFFDPIRRDVLELGGWSEWGNSGLNVMWTVQSTDTIGPVGFSNMIGSPGAVYRSPGGYDAVDDRLVIITNDLHSWPQPALLAYDFDRTGLALARPADSRPCDDRMCLRWSASAGTPFRLSRRASGGEWHEVATLTADAGGRLAYDDLAIEAGRTYGYRLTGTEPPYAPAAADLWLTASTSASFSFAPPWPNPVRESVTFAFTLPAAATGALELFDVAGRRVWSRPLAGLGPGPHHVALAAGRELRPGFYLARLRQGGRTTTRRVVLAP